jgi:DegV family protein with EDD domain
MVATCRAVAENCSVSRSLGKTVASMADAALEGARGNSGLILAQFLYGLSVAMEGHTSRGTLGFAEGLVHAVPYAEKALHHPMEGTVLTVLRDWSRYTLTLAGEMTDFTALLPLSLIGARESLQKTRQCLPALAREKVVDAGAQGLVDFLQGVADFMEQGNLKELALPGRIPERDHLDHPPHGKEMTFRYCTETLIEGEGISRETLMHVLPAFGDSVVVGGHGNRYRIHLHTDEPAPLFERLSGMGTLNSQKVDDIKRQLRAQEEDTPSIALLTDSCCDLPHSVMDRYGIHMIPLKLAFQGSTYLDRVTVHPERVYQIMAARKERITTSQPSLAEFTSLYSFLRGHYDSVVAIHLSGALSGTWNTSRQAAATIDPDNIHVIDSKTLSSGLGLLVLKAAKAVADGKKARQIVHLVEDAIPKSRTLVSLNTLKYLVRGGRLRPVAGFVAGLLNLKPIITIDEEGKVTHFGNARGREANVRKIYDAFRELAAAPGIESFAVVHAGAAPRAEKLAGELRNLAGIEPAYVMEISPVIGINTGPGSIGVSLTLTGDAPA